MSGYSKLDIALFGVPENFMRVIDNGYYIGKDVQSVDGIGKLSDGSVDPVALLYSEKGYEPYPGEDENNTDYYQVAVNDAAGRNKTEFENKPAWTLPILLPSGSENFFSIDAGTPMKFYSSAISNAY